VTETPAGTPTRSDAVSEAIRDARKRYDGLARGQTASIRRCRTADEVALEGTYWRIGGSVAHAQRNFPHVVLLFPLAPHAGRATFSFGRYLRRQLGDGDGAMLRVRRLLASRDRDELDHRLRGVMKLAGANGMPVDWGVLGRDILWFFAESDSVRRRWAQDFYAPPPPVGSRPAAAPSTSSTLNA
jgi:CRISPR type I-E-associated protein CasB/Cse2